jgi:Protein of unknown function (DUF1566)
MAEESRADKTTEKDAPSIFMRPSLGASEEEHHQEVKAMRKTRKSCAVVMMTAILLGGIGGKADAKDEGVTQNWDKTLAADNPGGSCPAFSSRFNCVMNGTAVRDNETGLVWEQSPSTTAVSWASARDHCAVRTVGNRHGWRLPGVAELTSLLAVAPGPTNPALPLGHPFSGIESFYWSATTVVEDPNAVPTLGGTAWSVDFNFPDIGVGSRMSHSARPWCVRGGMNEHKY